jgi:hypothetical protein
MALDPVVNFFRSQIATLPVASGGTVIVLPTGDGNKLPNPATDGAFNLTIYNADDPFVTPEIVRVTGRSGDTLTVTRAQEGTTATNKTAGSTWSVELTPTAKTIQDIDTKKVEKTGDTMTGTLTATKLIPSGNVTAGNGMYLPAANTVAVSTNGVERLRILSSGEVGIGGVPVYPLSVIRTSGSSVIQIQGENNAESTLLFGDADSLAIGRIVYSHVNDSFRFWTNGSERVRVTSTGNVGIGTTSPANPLHMRSGNSAGSVDVDIMVQDSSTSISTTDAGIIFTGTGTGGVPRTDIPWRVGTRGSNLTFQRTGTEHMRITDIGNVGIGTTAPATKLDVVGAIRASVGILFGTDTSAANTLSDYEQGTFTPVIEGATTAGTGTYNAQLATYTKVGRKVTVSVNLAWTAHTGTGEIRLSGLPFTSANNSINSICTVFTSEMDLGTNATNLVGVQTPNTSTMLFRGIVNNAVRTAPVIDTSVAFFQFTLTYITP